MGIFLEAMDLTIVKLVQPNQNTPNMALHRDAFSLALLAARALVSFALELCFAKQSFLEFLKKLHL